MRERRRVEGVEQRGVFQDWLICRSTRHQAAGRPESQWSWIGFPRPFASASGASEPVLKRRLGACLAGRSCGAWADDEGMGLGVGGNAREGQELPTATGLLPVRVSPRPPRTGLAGFWGTHGTKPKRGKPGSPSRTLDLRFRTARGSQHSETKGAQEERGGENCGGSSWEARSHGMLALKGRIRRGRIQRADLKPPWGRH